MNMSAKFCFAGLMLATNFVAAEQNTGIPEPGIAASSAMRAAVGPRLGVAGVTAVYVLPENTLMMGAVAAAMAVVMSGNAADHDSGNGADTGSTK